jgi:hypothetical protein
MKKWKVTFTFDNGTFIEDEVDGTSYTDAYVNTMLKHPGADITELVRC